MFTGADVARAVIACGLTLVIYLGFKLGRLDRDVERGELTYEQRRHAGKQLLWRAVLWVWLIAAGGGLGLWLIS